MATSVTRDQLDNPLSPAGDDQVQAYHQALTLFHGYYGDPMAAIQPALDSERPFAMGHCLAASLLLSATDRSLYAMAGEQLAAAAAAPTGPREQAHLQALTAWRDGDWERALQRYDALLAQWPRDGLALQMGHLGDFFLGRQGVLRDRPAAALPHWPTDLPGRGFVLGMHAFGLEECGQYERARETGLAALAHDRRDPWAIHAVAHVHEMRGEIVAGIDWLSARQDDWAIDNGFSFHNWWHMALGWLEIGEHQRVLALYDQAIRPADTNVVLELIDATAMLWRLHLRGVDVGQRWQPLLARWRSRVGDRLYVFNDIHALLALLASGQLAEAQDLVDTLQADAIGEDTRARMARMAGLPAARGLLAFAAGRHDQALPLLLHGHAVSARFGGSHAQRDLLALTALACARRSDARQLEEQLLVERRERRPNSPFVWNAIADWRERGGSGVSAELARDQARQAQRELLRLSAMHAVAAAA
jgi:tetratricopeptide (TPR) repeat protein